MSARYGEVTLVSAEAEAQQCYLAACFDEPWMAHLLRRHGLTGGRITVVTLLLFYEARLPVAVVRDFLGPLGDVAEPHAVLERAEAFVQRLAAR